MAILARPGPQQPHDDCPEDDKQVIISLPTSPLHCTNNWVKCYTQMRVLVLADPKFALQTDGILDIFPAVTVLSL
jgi:hypothetical protein